MQKLGIVLERSVKSLLFQLFEQFFFLNNFIITNFPVYNPFLFKLVRVDSVVCDQIWTNTNTAISYSLAHLLIFILHPYNFDYLCIVFLH